MRNLFHPNNNGEFFSPLPTLFVVPSGIGCALGGFAGDAIPVARLLGSASGFLITHPNVLNGASLFWDDPRIQYVEGSGIDRFATGEIGLRPVRKRKVGLLLDAKIEADLLQRHLEVANACRASLGLDIGPVVITEKPLEVKIRNSSSGSSWGELQYPDVLLNAADRLKDAGVSAVAVVTRFPDAENSQLVDNYRRGNGVDSLAGAEAVISHLLVRHLGMPCAHAPALQPLPIDVELDPRAAGEELGHTFLTCVLVGLSRAPDMIEIKKECIENSFFSSDFLSIHDLGAVVAPNGALGGEAVLACLEKGVPLILVKNPGVLNVDDKALGITNSIESKRKFNSFHANNYVEAAGLILALREGISKDALYRPFPRISMLS